MDGISSLHGAHQVAHTFSRTTCPRKSDRDRSLPTMSVATKSGASAPVMIGW